MSNDNKEDIFPIFPAKGVLEALKFHAYANTAYALAEIVDNAVTAGAKNIRIDVFCGNHKNGFGRHDTPRTIAVLDDGKGMDKTTLRKALQFGYGENYGKPAKDLQGLGRFGVGLMASSFNQCDSLSVWSWTEGLSDSAPDKRFDSALHASLIQKDMEHGQNNVSVPDIKEIPLYLREKLLPDDDISPEKRNPQSGTLILWDDLDSNTLSWKKASTLETHLREICGRIYRYSIAKDSLKIVLHTWGDQNNAETSKPFEAIDPLFLSTWEDDGLKEFEEKVNKFNRKNPQEQLTGGTLFIPHKETHGDDWSEQEKVNPKELYIKRGEQEIGQYRIMASHRRIPDVQKASGDRDPGSWKFGKTAKNLEGVSILRMGRELILDARWLSHQEADRWIKLSIDFDASLDQIFGVSNDKQNAHRLSALARMSIKDIKNERAEIEKRRTEYQDKEAEWERWGLLGVALEIQNRLKQMRNILDKRLRRNTLDNNSEGGESHSPEEVKTSILQSMTGVISQRALNYPALMDAESPNNSNKIANVYKDTFVNNIPAINARPALIIGNQLKFDFVARELYGKAIFEYRQGNGLLVSIYNKNHPIYEMIRDGILQPPIAEDDGKEQHNIQLLQKRLKNAQLLLQHLIASFNRAHHERENSHDNNAFDTVRLAWGQVAEETMPPNEEWEFLEDSSDEDGSDGEN